MRIHIDTESEDSGSTETPRLAAPLIDLTADEGAAQAMPQPAFQASARRQASPPPPSAPPLPLRQDADWADDFWRESGQVARAQLDKDEALARSLYEEELQQLSGEERDRLARLPGTLAESPLVRALAQSLSTTYGAFTRLIPAVNASIAAAAAAVAEPADEGRRRLEGRLKLFCLVEKQVQGDGACQFRALSDQLYRTPELHAFVRECVVTQLRSHADWYAPYVTDSDFEHYCTAMVRQETWGDHVTLQAAADFFRLRILVLSSFESDFLIEVEPRQRTSQRVLWLSFWAEVHYNSLYHADEGVPKETPSSDTLLGSRRLHRLVRGSGSSSGASPPRGSTGPWRIPVE